MLAGQGAGVSARRMLLRKARRMTFREKSATNAYIAAGGIHLLFTNENYYYQYKFPLQRPNRWKSGVFDLFQGWVFEIRYAPPSFFNLGEIEP